MRERLDHGLNLVKFFFFAKLTKRLLGGARINFNEGQGVVGKVTRGPNCIVIFITSEEFMLRVDFTKVRAIALEHLSLSSLSRSRPYTPLHRVSNLRFVKILSILRSTGPSLPLHPHILMWPGETCPTGGSGGGRGGVGEGAARGPWPTHGWLDPVAKPQRCFCKVVSISICILLSYILPSQNDTDHT